MYKKLGFLVCLVLVLGLLGSAAAQEVKGEILVEWWLNLSGNTVADVRVHSGFPDDPDGSAKLETFEVPQSIKPTEMSILSDNYGARVTGYLYPPANGDYTFWITSDNGGEFLLSTDDDPANATVICQVPGSEWTGAREWGKFPTDQKSEPVTLTGGKKYYVEAIYQESDGEDGVAIGWGGPTIGAGPVVIDGQYLSPMIRASDFMADDPVPADDTAVRDTWLNMQWSAGYKAASHDVYFGENFDDVNDGVAETFQGNQPLTPTAFMVGFTGFPYPDGLVPGRTYYWRIDEVNDLDSNSPWKGPVWSFWVLPYTAYDPHPPDGAEFVDLNVELSWTTGFGAKMHIVYFGDNFDDVNNAVVGIPQQATTYTPGTLELEKTYYWRVDESDGVTTHKGDILSFKTLSHIPITNTNLIGWWKLDGVASGTTAVDWSGYDHHGIIMGDPEWAIGYHGDALELDGDGDYVDIGSVGIRGIDPRTIAGWVKASTTAIPSWTTVFGFAHDGSGDGTYFDIGVDNAGNYGIHIFGWGAVIRAVDTRWHHFAATYDGSEGRWYVNGQFINRLAGAIATTDEVRIGARLSNNNYFPGLVDDVRTYNKALTQNEISEVMRGDPELASDPGPGNGSIVDVIEATPLSWLPGEKAAQHDVYFGTDKDAVADADTSDTTDIYRGRQGVTIYTPPEGVEWGGGSYYWRIDEYNTDATISKGNVWSFTVADYLIVDDFEDYDVGNNEIWWTWLDGSGYASHPTKPPYSGNGTGSMVGDENTGSYMEETIVHSGSQSMPVFYDNNQQGKLKYSEVEMTLSSRRDWTVEGVGVLTIWFHGAASNGAEPLYVAINGNTVVTHDNPNAAQIETWTQWDIDLQVFADLGVDLTNVDGIAIGLGNKGNMTIPGGSGKIFIDDIRLLKPAPEPEPQP